MNGKKMSTTKELKNIGKEEAEEARRYTRYRTLGEGEFLLTGDPIGGRFSKKLPPGIYEALDIQDLGLILQPKTFIQDRIIDIPESISEQVLKELSKFWTTELRKKYEDNGIVYKRGILLHGEPGTGKTIIVTKIMKKVFTIFIKFFYC